MPPAAVGGNAKVPVAPPGVSEDAVGNGEGRPAAEWEAEASARPTAQGQVNEDDEHRTCGVRIGLKRGRAMSFGGHLRALRQEAGLSRGELARRAAVPVSTLRGGGRTTGAFPALPPASDWPRPWGCRPSGWLRVWKTWRETSRNPYNDEARSTGSRMHRHGCYCHGSVLFRWTNGTVAH